MDRNSIIGFGLLILLVIGYVSYNNYSQNQFLAQKRIDSIAAAKRNPPKPLMADTVKKVAALSAADSILNDSIRRSLPAAYSGQAQTVKLENKNIALSFSTKGAQPITALLKDYKTYDHKPLYFFNGKGNELSALLPVNNGSTSTADLYYTSAEATNPNGDKTLTFTADMGAGKMVHVVYTLPAEGYMIGYNLKLDGMQAGTLPITWQTTALHTEQEVTMERNNSQVYYRYADEEHDYFSFINK